nr:MAG TPA: hypothetical protein [Caudoviricetes sp.]
MQKQKGEQAHGSTISKCRNQRLDSQPDLQCGVREV